MFKIGISTLLTFFCINCFALGIFNTKIYVHVDEDKACTLVEDLPPILEATSAGTLRFSATGETINICVGILDEDTILLVFKNPLTDELSATKASLRSFKKATEL